MIDGTETANLRPSGVATYVVRRGASAFEVLLLKRAGPRFFGEWFPVEGLISAGESIEDAARREIREETSLEVLTLYREEDPVASEVGIVIHVLVGFVAADAPVVLNYEHTHYEWLHLEEAFRRLSLIEQRDTLHRIQAQFLDHEPRAELLVRRRAPTLPDGASQ